MRFALRLTIFLFAVTSSLSLLAQSANVSGQVLDPQQAGVPGATVTLTRISTQVKEQTTTDGKGNFVLPPVPPGNYEIEAAAKDFSPTTLSGLTLEVGESKPLTLVLKVRGAQQSIEVSGTPPELNQSSANRSIMIEPAFVEGIPLNIRNPLQLIKDAAGVTNGDDGLSGQNSTSESRTNTFRINGSKGATTDVLIDGAANTTSYYNQDGGTLGGPVVIPKLYQGRNRTFFFVSYEGLRDTSAGSFTGTVPTALERQGNFSQTFDAKGNQIVIYNPYTTTTGTNYSRTAVPGNNINNISSLNPIGVALVNLYPLPNKTGTGGSDLDNFFSNAPNTDSNNSVDARIDHQLTSHQSIFGHITAFSNHINYSDYFGNGLSPEDANDRIPGDNIDVNHTWIIRPKLIFDHHFSWAHSESNRAEAVLKSPGSLGFNSSVTPGITANLTPQLSIAGPPAVGSYSTLGNYYPFEANFSSVYQYAATMTWVKGKHTLKYGIDWRRYPTQLWDPEQMSISSGGSNPGSNFTDGFSKGTTVISDSGSGVADLLLGLATVSSGYEPETRSVHDYRSLFVQDEFRVTPRLMLTYGVRYSYETGDVEANDLLNYLNLTAVSPLQPMVPSLSLTGGVGVPGLYGTSRQLQVPEMLHFDPRIGLAFKLDNNTVMHAGFGIFHHPAAAWQQYPNADAGIRTSTSIDAQPNGVTPLAGYQLGSPFPNGLPTPAGTTAGLSIDLGDSIEGPLRKQNIPYQENWSVDIQRTLPGSFVITAAYAGNEGVHLMVNEQLNQLPVSDEALGSQLLTLVPNPLYGLIDPASSINTTMVKRSQLLAPHPQFQNVEGNNIGVGHSSYHAGQLTVEHRLSHGLATTFAYTYSKAIDNVGEMTSVAGTMGAVTNTYCVPCDRSRSDQNEPFVIRWNTRYELPFGAGKPFLSQGWVKNFVGGWALSGIYQWDSGRPIAVSYTNVSDLNSSSTLSRPNIVPGVSDKIPGGPQIKLGGSYFNPKAFAATPTYSFGNASRYLSDVNTPASWDLDSMIEKTTQISERYSVSFRAEMFNTLNNVVFSGPTTSFTSSTFGEEATLTQNNTPRNIQLSTRFNF